MIVMALWAVLFPLSLIVIHEAGHAIGAWSLGLKVGLFFKFPIALGITAMTHSVGQRKLIASCGPASSILIGLALCASSVPGLAFIGFFSVAIGLVCLLPIKGFDGHHILR